MEWIKIKEQKPLNNTLCILYNINTCEFIIGKVINNKIKDTPLSKFKYWCELERPE